MARTELKLPANTTYRMTVKYVDWSVHPKYGAGVKVVFEDGEGNQFSKIFSEHFAKLLKEERVAMEETGTDRNGNLVWRVAGTPTVDVWKEDRGEGKTFNRIKRLDAVPSEYPADFGPVLGPKPSDQAVDAAAAAPAPAAPAPVGGPGSGSAPAPAAGPGVPAPVTEAPATTPAEVRAKAARGLAAQGELMAACLWLGRRAVLVSLGGRNFDLESPGFLEAAQAVGTSIFIQATRDRVGGFKGMTEAVQKMFAEGAPAPTPAVAPPAVAAPAAPKPPAAPGGQDGEYGDPFTGEEDDGLPF